MNRFSAPAAFVPPEGVFILPVATWLSGPGAGVAPLMNGNRVLIANSVTQLIASRELLANPAFQAVKHGCLGRGVIHLYSV